MFGLRTPFADVGGRPHAADDSGDAHRTMFGLRALADDALGVPPTPLDSEAVGARPAAGWGGVPPARGGEHGPEDESPARGVGPRGPGRFGQGAPASSHTMVGLSAYVPDDGGPEPTPLDDSLADDWLDDIQNFIDKKIADGSLDVPRDAVPAGPAPVDPWRASEGGPPGTAPPVERSTSASTYAQGSRSDSRENAGVAGFGIVNVKRHRGSKSRSETGRAPVATAGTTDHHELWEQAREHHREEVVEPHGGVTRPIAVGGDDRLVPPAAPAPPAEAAQWGSTMRFSPEEMHAASDERNYGIEPPPPTAPVLEASAAYAFIDAAAAHQDQRPEEPVATAVVPPGARTAAAGPPPRSASVSEDLLSVAARQRLPAATGSVVRPVKSERRITRLDFGKLRLEPKWVLAGVVVFIAVAAIVLVTIIVSGGAVPEHEVAPETAEPTP